MTGIAGIGLDPVTAGPQQLRGRSHLDVDPRPAQKPRQPEPRRARLVRHRHRTRQAPDPGRDVFVRRGQPLLRELARRPVQGRRHHRPCMHIQANARTLNNHWGPPTSVALRPGQPLTATHVHMRSRPPARAPIPSRIARTGGAMDQDEPTLRSLRLDDLLRELVARAEDVLEVEDRLQRLLDAVISVASDLRLPHALRRIFELAVELADARYGALGVIGPDGRLSQFVTAGVEDELRRRIGDLPSGHGILGVLIRDPRPLRIANLAEHGGRVGFPANHPLMTTFLGVPVRSRGEVFGNLYLTEKLGGGEFTERDEDVVVALAAAAGVAIENSRLFEEVRRRESWLSAASEVTTSLLAGADAAVTAQLVVAKAAELVRADAAVLLLSADDGFTVGAVHGGPDAAELE